jgi:hypothetical protein
MCYFKIDFRVLKPEHNVLLKILNTLREIGVIEI